MTISKGQRRPKSYRGCTQCRERRKKCSEGRPCTYCIKTCRTETCRYVGLENLIRFDRYSPATAKSKAPTTSKPSSPSSRSISPCQTTVSCGSPWRALETCIRFDQTLPIAPSASTSTTEPITSEVEEDISLSSSQATSPIDNVVNSAEFSMLDFLPAVTRQSPTVSSQIYPTLSPFPFHLDPSPWRLSNGLGFPDDEIPYVHYWLYRLPRDSWFSEFSGQIAVYVGLKAKDHPILRHAVISMAATLASLDTTYTSEPSQTCIRISLEHKQKALQLIRQRIQTADVDGYVAGAIAILLRTEMDGPSARSHMQGLKSVLDHLQSKYPGDICTALRGQDSDAPLVGLCWNIALRFDIGQATIAEEPIFEALPLTQEFEILQREWMGAICPWSISGQGVELGMCVFTLRILLHRAFHIASIAKRKRRSPDYNAEKEQEIQKLCAELNRDLDDWLSKPIIQQAKLEELLSNPSPTPSIMQFLHYSPLSIHNFGYHKLMSDYRSAKLFTSFLSNPTVGPGPPDSRRFELAIELCRSMAAARFDLKYGFLWDGSRLFHLFLCRLVFGGDEYYPLESKGVMKLFEELLPENWGVTVQEIMDIWVRNFPALQGFTLDDRDRSLAKVGSSKFVYSGMDLVYRSI